MFVLVIACVFLLALWAITLGFGLPLAIALVGTALAVLLVGGRFAWQKLRADKGSREIERALSTQAEQFAKRARPDQHASVQGLQNEFEKALATLKSSKLSKGKGGALY